MQYTTSLVTTFVILPVQEGCEARCQYLDEGDNTSFHTANGEVDIEDDKETDLGMFTTGEEEPEIETKPKNNNHQHKDCHNEKKDVTRICARTKQFGSM